MAFKYLINKDIADVKSELQKILADEVKKSYVTFSWDKYELTIKIEKMGTSTIGLFLKEEGDKSVSINEGKRNISMMHKPFAGDVEKMVGDILGNKLGAQKVS